MAALDRVEHLPAEGIVAAHHRNGVAPGAVRQQLGEEPQLGGEVVFDWCRDSRDGRGPRLVKTQARKLNSSTRPSARPIDEISAATRRTPARSIVRQRGLRNRPIPASSVRCRVCAAPTKIPIVPMTPGELAGGLEDRRQQVGRSWSCRWCRSRRSGRAAGSAHRRSATRPRPSAGAAARIRQGLPRGARLHHSTPASPPHAPRGSMHHRCWRGSVRRRAPARKKYLPALPAASHRRAR